MHRIEIKSKHKISAKSLIIAALLVLPAIINASQNPPLAFEVISVKPVKPVPTGGQRGPNADKGAGLFDVENHRFTAHAVTLYSLAKWSYGITAGSCLFKECDFLTGGPDWVRSDQFDIQALMPNDSPIYTFRQTMEGRAPALQAMLQAMLEDRFKLVVRRQMKEMPAYVLTIARGGHKLTPSKADVISTVNITRDTHGDSFDLALHAQKSSIFNLVRVLETLNFMDRPILDRTGLSGEFNFEMKFAPPNNNAFANTTSPSLFTAVQEQLGLRLESTKAPVEIFVIDHAEKPSEN
jgi:uncharacterized protein (TIGR03435 family)